MKCLRVGILLSQVRAVRVIADYQLDEAFGNPDGQSAIDSVLTIRQLIAEAEVMKA